MPNPDTWQANTSYTAGDIIRATSGNEAYLYKALNDGTSGASEPTWPTAPLEKVTDNEIEWVCIKKWAKDNIIDQALNYIRNHATAISVCEKSPSNYYQACDPPEWQANTDYSEDDVVRPVGARTGFVYRCTTAGTSGVNEPDWPTAPGETIEDGTLVWECYESYALCTDDSVTASDLTITLAEGGAKKIAMAEKSDITIYKTGVGRAVSLLNDADRELLITTTPTTEQNFQEGALAKITNFEYEIKQPDT